MMRIFLPISKLKQHMYFIKRFRVILILITLTAIVISLTESISVTLIIPLLDGLKEMERLPLPFPFNRISPFFAGMGLKERIQIVALLMLFITVLKGVFRFINTCLANHFQERVVKYFRMLCIKQLMSVKMGYFNVQRFGHIQSNIITNTAHVGSLLFNCATIVPKLISIFLLVSILFVLSWKMTIFSIVLGVLSSFILRRISHKSAIAGKARVGTHQNLSSSLFDILVGMKIIRLFNQEDNMMNGFDESAEQHKIAGIRLQKIKALVTPLFEITSMSCLVLVMIAGSIVLASYGDALLQILLIFLIVFLRLMPMVNIFNVQRVAIAGYWPYLDIVLKFIKCEDDLYIKNGVRQFSGLKKGIEMRGITFSYNPEEMVVLQNISLFIPKGSKVGIVGSSGSGKSTITELLLRFYDPQKGQILIDGIDLKEFDFKSWRRHIGVVTQDTFLFNDTVRANISFAKPKAGKEEIEDAARRAHAHDFISEFPRGYSTMLGERGVRLSGGQRQRIAIARAILSNPKILIFDEATSSLDTESEQIVQVALDEIGQGKTVFTIAHRLFTIYEADLIFVLQAGRIVQVGTHKQLLNQEGIYKNLVQYQVLT